MRGQEEEVPGDMGDNRWEMQSRSGGRAGELLTEEPGQNQSPWMGRWDSPEFSDPPVNAKYRHGINSLTIIVTATRKPQPAFFL